MQAGESASILISMSILLKARMLDKISQEGSVNEQDRHRATDSGAVLWEGHGEEETTEE